MTKPQIKAGDRLVREIIRLPDYQEIKIIEVSPCGKWVKYAETKTEYAYWMPIDKLKIISRLNTVKG